MADQQEPYPKPVYSWYVVTILFLAYVLSFMDRQILSLLIEPIKEDLQISDTVISLLHGFAFAIFYTIMGIPLGRLADSRNRKGIIMLGVSIWSPMTALCGFAQSTMMLFFTRIGVGVGEAALSPSAYSMISDYFPKEKRGRAISFYSMGVFVGAGMAFMFGGMVADFAAHATTANYPLIKGMAPWRLTFILAALPGILIILLMLTIREPERREKLKSGDGGITIKEAFTYLKQHWQTYFTLILGTSLTAVASFSLFAWTPAYFIRVYEYTPREIGTMLGLIILVMGTTGLLSSSYLADRIFSKGHVCAHLDVTIIITGMGIVPAAFLMTIGTPQAALICISLMVFTLSVTNGLIPTTLQMITPNELRGQVIAIYIFTVNLIGMGCGPTIVALITDHYYQETMAVGNSMSLTQTIALIIGVSILFAGRQAYIKRQRKIQAEG